MFDITKVSPTIRHAITKSMVPMKTIGMEFSDLDNSKAREVTESWVSTVQSGVVVKSPGSPSSGLGLLLVGEPGHGKTTLASVALQSLIRTMSFPTTVQGVFYDYPKFLRLEKDSWTNQESKSELEMVYGDGRSYVPLFVLDDLGKEYRTATDWSGNVFDALLRARFNAGLPTIVTTNVPMRKWRVTYGEAMESFAHEAFINVEVESDKGDRRK